MQKLLDYKKGVELFKKYKIKIPKGKLVKSKEEAAGYVEKIGYPLVLKLISKDISHKTDANVIFTNINSKEELLKRYDLAVKNAKKYNKKAKIQGILIQKMVLSDIALILGAKRDDTFGDVVIAGSGGIYTEILKDISMRICPITKKDAFEMLAETKIYDALKGYRNKKINLNNVVDVILKLAKIIEKNKDVKEIDVNPLFVLENDVAAADIRIISD
ncbi:acetate--CoA ligase family protein [Candidatus Woesearchaeota archaeon]|nr:acetate--CoA ligase family protein [Candidatus Woesearchaeota archaeon]